MSNEPSTAGEKKPVTPYVRQRPAHRSVEPIDDLAQELTFHSAGETCEVVVYRSGEYQTLTVTFDSVPETDTSTSPTDYFFPAA